MSLARRAARRDVNEPAVVNALRELGCVVVPISAEGVPDLAVGYLGRNHWVEVKHDNETLNAKQAEWHDAWATAGERPLVVRTEAHARKAVKMWLIEFAKSQTAKGEQP